MVRFLPLTLWVAIVVAQTSYREWNVVGGSADGIHYSSLSQINARNVRSLRIAWKFDSHDEYVDSDIQCNPIVVDGVMFVTTPTLRVVALDAATGREIWSFDGAHGARAPHPARGLTYWSNGKQSRIFETLDTQLLSLDAKTGKLDPAFGTNGAVDMRAAFDPPLKDTSLSVTSPGAIYRDLIILGSSVSEALPATPGDIRAYDVRTGKLRWIFHTIPHPGEFGYDTWPPGSWKTSGAANNWAGLTVDAKRGLVFVPTGSAAADFYGADRHGDNLFANTLLCLNAETGQRKWHFQAVRHDVWDQDFPCPPLLVTVKHNGKTVDAVAQAGKTGYIYVLDRETGKSLFPLQELPVPPSSVDGELLAKSQPVPIKPEPFVRQGFTEATVTNRSEAAHQAVLKELQSLDHGPAFTSPSLRGSILFPGAAGGAEWGGSAYDPETHFYYVNANEMPWLVRLAPPEAIKQTALASEAYKRFCGGCHGQDMKGAPPDYPALDHLAGAMTDEGVTAMIRKGGGRMPQFSWLGEPAINGLKDLLIRKVDKPIPIEIPERLSVGLKYSTESFRPFLDPDGYPANTPPWGSLSAINLDTGDYVWKIPFGEYPELVAKGIKSTGSENHGGGVVTAGGLFFIGATHYDNKFRAFDKKTGKVLWETVLPYAANATPAVYELNGKEYVAVAVGGGRGRHSGGSFIAFALP
jgi:quinoprotein glucose dehydrogenase